MSSAKEVETRKTAVETADKTKAFGDEKAGHAEQELDAANKEAEAQLETANKTNDPTITEQAKEKAAQAKKAAANAHQKVTGAVADSWTKTKETLSNLNQYPDKK